MTVLGALTSAIYNTALERSAFAQETFIDYFVWGRRTSFMPFMVLLAVCLAGVLLQAVRRLLISTSEGLRRAEVSLRRRANALAHRCQLDDASVLGGWVLLLSVAVLIAACWYFSPLLLALSRYVSTASSSDLQLLSPDNVYYHNRYRQVFTGVVLLPVVGWYPVLRLVKKGQSLGWGMWVGVAVVTCMALFFLHFPYRLLVYRNYFDVVRWNDQQCAVLGERDARVLLYCPQLPQPRTRTVNRNQDSVISLGKQQRLFERF